VAPGPYDADTDDYGLATFSASLGRGANATATRITDADPTNGHENVPDGFGKLALKPMKARLILDSPYETSTGNIPLKW
jgi:hypothetical protein